jgi:hypothetical protein
MEKEQLLLDLVEQTQGDLNTMVKHLEIDEVQELPDDVAMLVIKKVVDPC